MKAKFILFRGMERIEVEADSIAIVTEDKKEFELGYHKDYETVTLSTNRGSLVVKPRASNVIHLDSER